LRRSSSASAPSTNSARSSRARWLGVTAR
jgi:hypothetical protein